VRDNAAGFCGERTGRGIASMKHRATIIGGPPDIQPSAAGTTLNLLLPATTNGTHRPSDRAGAHGTERHPSRRSGIDASPLDDESTEGVKRGRRR
jgi:hypothetical protein